MLKITEACLKPEAFQIILELETQIVSDSYSDEVLDISRFTLLRKIPRCYSPPSKCSGLENILWGEVSGTRNA